MAITKPRLDALAAVVRAFVTWLTRRDGWVLKGAESIPVAGFLLAFVDLLRGDTDRALRATAKCTYATIVTGSSLLGGIVGGGPVGVGLGAASATPVAMLLQSFIAENFQNPTIRKEVLVALTPEAVLAETISNGLIFGLGAHFTELFADLLGPFLTKLGAGHLLARGARYLFRLFW